MLISIRIEFIRKDFEPDASNCADFNMVKIESRLQTRLNQSYYFIAGCKIINKSVLVVKTIVVRKSVGQQCPCRFESGLSYEGFIAQLDRATAF